MGRIRRCRGDAALSPTASPSFAVPANGATVTVFVSREQSHILVIWHAPTSRHETDIEAIRTAYTSRFDQESVMRVEGWSCVSF